MFPLSQATGLISTAILMADQLLILLMLQPASRKYILLYLWEAREGGGVVASKLIMSSAKRLRVT